MKIYTREYELVQPLTRAHRRYMRRLDPDAKFVCNHRGCDAPLDRTQAWFVVIPNEGTPGRADAKFLCGDCAPLVTADTQWSDPR